MNFMGNFIEKNRNKNTKFMYFLFVKGQTTKWRCSLWTKK